MSASLEERVKNLEVAFKHLQKMAEERYEELQNDFSNRSESQYHLLKHLFQQHQMMKELIRSVARELQIEETQFEALMTQAKEHSSYKTIQDDFLEEYQKELGNDNVGS